MLEITFTDLKKMNMGDMQAGECIKVSGLGWNSPAMYVIPKAESEMKIRIEAICSQIDAGAGTVPDDVGATPLSDLIDNYRNGVVADPEEVRETLLALGATEGQLDGTEPDEDDEEDPSRIQGVKSNNSEE